MRHEHRLPGVTSRFAARLAVFRVAICTKRNSEAPDKHQFAGHGMPGLTQGPPLPLELVGCMLVSCEWRFSQFSFVR